METSNAPVEHAQHGDTILATNETRRASFGKTLQVVSTGPDTVIGMDEHRTRFTLRHTDYEIKQRAGRPATTALPTQQVSERVAAITYETIYPPPVPFDRSLIELKVRVGNYEKGRHLVVSQVLKDLEVMAYGPGDDDLSVVVKPSEYRILPVPVVVGVDFAADYQGDGTSKPLAVPIGPVETQQPVGDLKVEMPTTDKLTNLTNDHFAPLVPHNSPIVPKHSHYFKPCPFPHVDIYRVLSLFGVTDPCLQHAVKKLLVAGGRGHKDIERDVQEAIDTLARWQDMRVEEGAAQ